MSGNLALMWERGNETALPPIIGTEAVEVEDCRDVRGLSIVELKADLAFHFMRHSPRPRFERVEVRLMKLVPDPPKLHTRLPPPNGPGAQLPVRQRVVSATAAVLVAVDSPRSD